MFNATENAANFSRALGNGAAALGHLHTAVAHVVETANNDATPIARLIDKARAKGDDGAARAVAFFVKEIWATAKVTNTKGKPASVKIAGSPFNADAVGILAKAVADGLSLRSQKLKALYAKPEVSDAETEEETETAADGGETIAADAPAPTATAEVVEPRVLGLTAVYALALELSPEDRTALCEMIMETLATPALAVVNG